MVTATNPDIQFEAKLVKRPRWISINDAAKILGESVESLARKARDGKYHRCFCKGGGQGSPWKFREDLAEQYGGVMANENLNL